MLDLGRMLRALHRVQCGQGPGGMRATCKGGVDPNLPKKKKEELGDL